MRGLKTKQEHLCIESSIAVVIATKNRHLALRYISLPSLVKSRFKDFLTVVWDASENDLARQETDKFSGLFNLEFFKAPRVGSSSQRNDAADYVITNYPSVKYILFIDDDSRLSPDALEGVTATFEKYPDAWGLGVPAHDKAYPYDYAAKTKDGKFSLTPEKPLAYTHRFVTKSLKQDYRQPDWNDVPVEWVYGCGMAYRREVWSVLKMRFNEDLQLFGGYAFHEDLYFGVELQHTFGKQMRNSVHGYLVHLTAPGGRLDGRQRAAADICNFSLVFNVLNRDSGFFYKCINFIRFQSRFLNIQLKNIVTEEASFKDFIRGYWMGMKAYWRFCRQYNVQSH